ncbi:uncharacterized protein LOC128502324 [Spea bombifrons]|uniref:uncharacterized protein LOC128502324 n=1 Tax=Spea bombifrons TaxID=233779 RepID=UPI00234948E7|nr:uncharacterized protein LOC128502324 [Spea bombifrons]
MFGLVMEAAKSKTTFLGGKASSHWIRPKQIEFLTHTPLDQLDTSCCLLQLEGCPLCNALMNVARRCQDLEMGCKAEVSLAFLYKNDPFYSLCLSDLMTAPQSVTNQFLKEQRNLTETLKRLDHHQRSRLGQLNEEKRQFAHLMSRRLAPRISQCSSMEDERVSRRTSSAKTFSDLTSVKGSFHTLETASTVSSLRSIPTISAASNNSGWNCTAPSNVSQPFFITVLPKNRCHLRRNEKNSSALGSEHIGKTISHVTYRIK